MSVSIVVNYYNNDRLLAGLIDNYAALSKAKPGYFELVLVDDASPEPIDPKHFENVANLRVFPAQGECAMEHAGRSQHWWA